jgi:hypothetical protein
VLYESIPELSAKDEFQSGRADPLLSEERRRVMSANNLNFIIPATSYMQHA